MDYLDNILNMKDMEIILKLELAHSKHAGLYIWYNLLESFWNVQVIMGRHREYRDYNSSPVSVVRDYWRQ